MLVLQLGIFIILFKGSSQEAGLKKRVAIKKLQLEEKQLEKKIKSSGMPSLSELVNGGVIEPVYEDNKEDGGSKQDPKNRGKIGF